MSDEIPVKDYTKLMLRLPPQLRDSIAERAKRNERSMNSEIIAILTTVVSRDRLPYVDIQDAITKLVQDAMLKMMLSDPDTIQDMLQHVSKQKQDIDDAEAND